MRQSAIQTPVIWDVVRNAQLLPERPERNLLLPSPCPSLGLQGCRRFQSSAVNYSTMLLEAESGRLYVGARGAAFALNASDISAGTGLTVSLFCSHVVGVGGAVVRRLGSQNL